MFMESDLVDHDIVRIVEPRFHCLYRTPSS